MTALNSIVHWVYLVSGDLTRPTFSSLLHPLPALFCSVKELGRSQCGSAGAPCPENPLGTETLDHHHVLSSWGHQLGSSFPVIFFGIKAQVNNSAAFLLLQHARQRQLAKVLLGSPCFQYPLTSDASEFNSAPLIISESVNSVE